MGPGSIYRERLIIFMNLYTTTQSAHWYRPNGEPAYDADLRRARKEHLLPSVTTIQKARANPRLVGWLQTQAVLSALTLPRVPGETDDEFAKRAVADSGREASDAANWGTSMHGVFELALSGKPWEQAAFAYGLGPWMDSFATWMDKFVRRVIATEAIVINRDLGYGGKLDAVIEMTDGWNAVLDFKGRNIKNGKIEWYPDQPEQLSAYKLAGGYGDRTRLMSVIVDRNQPEIHTRVWTGPEEERALKRWKSVLQLWKDDHEYYP